MPKNYLNTVCFLLNLLWIFIGFELTCTAVVIRVSKTTGSDTSSCLVFNAKTPCKTIKFALDAIKDSNDTDFVFLIEEQVYYLEQRITIIQTSPDKNVILKSNHINGSTIYCMNNFAGFVIGSDLYLANKTRNINFVNLEFENCGPRFPAVVMIRNSLEINFTNCVFKDNKQAGINGFDSGVIIDRCHFLNNTPKQPTNSSSGGGARFFFKSNTMPLSVIIRSSNFTSNSVPTNSSRDFVESCSNLSTCSYTRGGGLLIMFQDSASGCRVVIQDTIFLKNSATFGGGVYFSDSDMTSGNSFSITNSTFLRNIAGQAGGGLMFTRWDNASSINTVFKNCIVSENWSRRGAGINVFLMNNNEKPTDSVLRFDTVVFSKNFGNASTAVRFTTALPFGRTMDLTPEFIDCIIADHSMSNFAHTSPFTSQRVNMNFKGRNVFMRNNGGGTGAAALQDCVINVQGQLVFTDNSGTNGGAVLLESSQIILHPHSELMFLRNKARGLGGAICVFEHTMDELMQSYNPNCFLAYSDSHAPPSSWKTNVSFIENSCMVRGAAIYVSSLQRCVWTEKFPHHNRSEALRWSSRFVYKNNFLFTEAMNGSDYDIATDTIGFHLNSTNENSSVKLAPGQTIPLNVHAVDELGHLTVTLAFVSEADNHKQKLQLQNPPFYLLWPNRSSTVPFSFNVPETLYKSMQPKIGKDKRKIQIMDFYSSLENEAFFELELQTCRPGFQYSPESKVCECHKQTGILSCDKDGKLVLEEGYWAGITSNGSLVTYFCPQKYCNCTRAPGYLQGCLFDPDNRNEQCSKNREGWLCGKCSGNTSVGLRWHECIDCPKAGWLLAVVIIVVIFLCTLVIWLNPSISSELRGPLFFFQVIPYIFDPPSHLGEYVFFVTELFNFGSPMTYFSHTCIIKGINNLYAVAFGYARPVLALTVFLLAYVLSINYCLRFNFRRNSMLQSFWLLLVFIYSYFVETSLRILFCPKVGDKYVFFYDGTVECFRGQHLPIAVIAILVLVFLVIPPPIMVFLLTNGYWPWKVDPQYANTLRRGLRPECCSWWSVDLCRRVLLVATYVAVADWKTKKFLMIFECVVILAVHNYCRPYLRARANLAEFAYLLVLCVLAILPIMEGKQDELEVVAMVLLVILACHTLVIFLCKATHFFRNRFHCECVWLNRSTRRRGYDEIESTKAGTISTIYESSEESWEHAG